MSLLFPFWNQDVNVASSGVAAAAAIGSGQIDVDFALIGIAASASIGAGSVDIDFVAAGVSASAALGAGSFDVDLTLTGVAGSAAIGTGTLEGAIDVFRGVTLAAATVVLGAVQSRRGKDSGVAAKAAIGVGYVLVDVEITSAQTRQRIFQSQHNGRVICDVVFSAPGCRAPAIIRDGRVICDVIIQPSAIGVRSKIGRGKIISIVDLTDEEICAILAIAA